MKRPRPVHYRSATGRGLRFPCYDREMKQHIDSAVDVSGSLPGWTRTVYPVPQPKRITDLSKVTCKECWFNIEMMAAKNRGRRFKVVEPRTTPS